jgi:hypothetical protein
VEDTQIDRMSPEY